MLNTAKPTNVRWTVFALASSTSWLLYLHRYAFALIKPKLVEEWQLDAQQLGALDSAFFITYSFFQLPLGVATDVWGVRLVLTGMIVVWTVGLGMHAMAGSSSQMWYARATLGLGQSAVYAALTRVSRQWFPPSIRTTLQGMVNVLAGRVGGLSANLLFSTLLIGSQGLDWRGAVHVFEVLGVLLALAMWIVLRNTPKEHPRVNAAELALIADPVDLTRPAAVSMTMRQMLGSLDRRGLLNLLAINVQTILSTVADNIYSNWIPLFLWSVHGLKDKELGIYGALPLLGGAVAGVLGGMLNDLSLRWSGNRRWSRSGVALVGKSLAAVILFVALQWYDSPYVFCTLLFFVKLVGDWSLTTMTGVITDVGGQATASVYAFNNAIAAVGSIAAPIVIGSLVDHRGWPTVFVAVAVTYALCALSWLVIDCTIPLVRSKSD
jgi:sugar phosphate permease